MHAARQTSTGCAGRLVLHGKTEEPARVVRPDLLGRRPWTPALFVLAPVTIVVNRLVFEPLDSASGFTKGRYNPRFGRLSFQGVTDEARHVLSRRRRRSARVRVRV